MNHETSKTITILTTVKNLQNQVDQFTLDIHRLKNEHQSILTENIELKERLKIFELNLADFPDQTLSEYNVEIQGINSKLKTHTEFISKLQKEISFLRKDISKIAQNFKTLMNIAQTANETAQNIPAPSPPITTAANLLNHKETIISPKITAELNAYTQMLLILEENFKNGGISQENYQQKRLKFEKRIAELQ